jgi:multidrug efflux pump subunit AcrB
MKLPRIAIEYHHFTIVVFILLTIFGVSSFISMPRSEDPAVSPPGTSVSVIYPGSSPTDLESLVVDPIEEVLNELEDIKTIESYASHGFAIVSIEFLAGSDDEEKYTDVVQKVNSIRGDLPEDIMSLETIKWTTTAVAILQIALVSDTAVYSDLEREAKRLKKMLEKTPGVKEVETMGYPEREVRVSVDTEKISQMRIPLSLISDAIEINNANIPGGSIDIGEKKFTIKTSGSYDSLDGIRNTIIYSVNDRPLYLKDIADIRFSYKDETYRARFNGRRCVFVTVTQKERTNIFHIMDDIRKRVTAFEEQLPDSISVEYVVDQTDSVSTRINSFLFNLLQGLIIVGIVVFIGVGLRASAVVMTAIPLSFLIAIGFVNVSGYGLQQMSIVGLVIALGLLVDNAIVVTENVSRFLTLGYSHREAAVKGTQQIGWAVVSATATTVLAFVPIIMMKDITGEFIRSMPVTVIYTLSASLIIALTLTPYLSSVFLKIGDGKKRQNFKERIGLYLKSRFKIILDFALSHRVVTVIITVLIFAASLAVFPILGFSLFPKAEKPQFLINIDTPQGTTLDQTDKAAKFVESVLASRDEVKLYAVNVGKGNPPIYYNVQSASERSNHAQIFIQLKRYDEEEMSKMIDELRLVFAEYPGATIVVKELQQGPPVEAPIAIKLLGEDMDVLEDISHDVEKIFAEQPGTININNPLKESKTDLYININREKAGLLGIPLVEIDRTVRTGITGMAVSKYRDRSGKEYDIVIRLPFENKPAVSDFNRIYVSSISGALIPLMQVASVDFRTSPTGINHYNLERAVSITADVLSGYSIDETTKSIMAKLNAYSWPKGYRYHTGGELESRERSFGGLRQAFLIALIAIFAVLVLQFRSYTQPLIVFSAIPFAVIGSFFALLITRNTFSFTAFIGLTGLIGIVINNSILLVEYSNQLMREGKQMYDAVKTAAQVRFKPILLTTFTTIGGLLPLTLRGGTIWAPFGWTLIGGLASSTFLTLVVVPVLYTIFTRSRTET